MTHPKSQPTPPVTPAKREEQNGGSQRFNTGPMERRAPNLVAQDGGDVSGWDSYRRWLSRVQLPDKRRIAMDPALYTWKGYRTWAEKARRDWGKDE